MKKRIISVLLSIMLCLSLMPTTVFAAEEINYVNASNLVEYPVENGNITFDTSTGYITGAGMFIKSAIIPRTINGVTVKGIGELAFDWCRDLTKITLPNTLEEIGEYAFRQCDSLESIIIPDSVKTIGECAFIYSSLESIIIPDSVTNFGDRVFEDNTNLRSATIGKGISTIPEGTFAGCYNLKDVNIPDTISVIGVGAFGTTGLEQITLPSSIVEIKDSAFANCQSLSTVNFNEGLKKIGKEAFFDCFNMQIVLPASLEEIGEAAFEANLSDNIQVATDNKFFAEKDGVLFSKDMKKLIQYPIGRVNKEYTVPDGVTEICAYAFGADYGHSIGYYVSLEKVVLPNSVVSIGAYAFGENEKLTQINFPAKLKTIGEYAFCDTKLVEVKLPEGLTQLGEGAFYWCREIKDVRIPSTLNTIPEKCFYFNQSLKEVVIPEGVVNLGSLCFDGTSALEIITVPKSVIDCGGYIDGFLGYNNRIGSHPEPITIVGYVDSAVYEWYLVEMGAEDPQFNLIFEEMKDVGILGDVDLDGKVTINDATVIQRYLAEMVNLNNEQIKLGDVDNNGKIDINDATMIQRYLAELIAKFPVQ